MDISFLLPYELEYGKWHRSKDNTGDSANPFCSAMINKKWWLEEELNNHILQFQQVNIESLLLNISICQTKVGKILKNSNSKNKII